MKARLIRAMNCVEVVLSVQENLGMYPVKGVFGCAGKWFFHSRSRGMFAPDVAQRSRYETRILNGAGNVEID